MYRSIISLAVTLSVFGTLFTPLAAEAAARPVRPTPQKVFEVLLNTKSAPLTAFSGTVTNKVSVTAPKKPAKKSADTWYTYIPSPSFYKVEFNGYADNRDTDIFKTFFDGTITDIKLDAKGKEIGRESGGANFMSIDKAVYVNVPNEKYIKLINEYSTSTKLTIDTWFKLDFGELMNRIESLVDDRGLKEKTNDLTENEKTKLKKAFLKSGVATLRYQKEEKINGVLVYTYIVSFNKLRLMPFLREVNVIMEGKKLTKQDEKEIADFLKKYKTVPNVSVSVRKDTLRLARVVTKSYSKEKDSAGYTIEKNNVINIVLEYPEAVPSIVEPSNTIDVLAEWDKYVEESKSKSIFGGSNFAPGASATQVNDNYRLSDLRQLQTALELYYTDMNRYPSGESLLIGSEETRCLNQAGWLPSACYSPYMANIHKDPGQYGYRYTVLQNGSSYKIDARLDGNVNELSDMIQLSPSGIVKK